MNNKIVLFIILITSCIACHDDELPIVCDYPPQEIIPCEEIGIDLIPILSDTCYEIPFNPLLVKEDIYPLNYYPIFNPNNPNEFACYSVTKVGENYNYDLIIFDLCDGGKTVLDSWETPTLISAVFGEITWGVNNWIGFNIENELNTHFISAPETNIITYPPEIQITARVAWIDSLLFYGNMRLENGQIKGVLSDFDNQVIIDTFLTHHFDQFEYFNNYLWASDFNKLYKINLTNNEELLVFESLFNIFQIAPKDEDNLYLLDRAGLYLLNLTSLELDTLLVSCDNLQYLDFSKHSDRDEILLFRNQVDLIGDSLLIRQFSISIFDPIINEEHILDLE